MSEAKVNLLLNIFGVVWVGGGGWLMFRYPHWFARVNASLGLRSFATPGYMRFVRWLGATELILAGLGVVSLVINAAFGIWS